MPDLSNTRPRTTLGTSRPSIDMSGTHATISVAANRPAISLLIDVEPATPPTDNTYGAGTYGAGLYGS